MTAVRGAAQQLLACGAVARVGEDAWERAGDQRCARERLLVALRVVAFDVERLGAVREPVQCGAGRDVRRQVERQVDVVDDRHRVRACAAALHHAVGRADPVERRPLGAGVRRRDVHDGLAAVRGGELAEVDRGAAADREDPVCDSGYL
jgi:hypothetical protein